MRLCLLLLFFIIGAQSIINYSLYGHDKLSVNPIAIIRTRRSRARMSWRERSLAAIFVTEHLGMIMMFIRWNCIVTVILKSLPRGKQPSAQCMQWRCVDYSLSSLRVWFNHSSLRKESKQITHKNGSSSEVDLNLCLMSLGHLHNLNYLIRELVWPRKNLTTSAAPISVAFSPCFSNG